MVGIVAMIPFVVTNWYTGFIAKAMNGADLALFVGLGASAISYIALARTIDFARELDVAAQHKARYGEHAVAFGQAAEV